MQINASLCLHSLVFPLAARSAAAFNVPPLGTEWEDRTRRRYSFLSHHIIRFPLKATLMILSPNDICLRPIRTLHPDNVSTGITSGGISSAPVRWAGDTLGQWCRWNYTACPWLHEWSRVKWNPGWTWLLGRGYTRLLRKGSQSRSTQEASVPQVNLAERHVPEMKCGFDRSRPWLSALACSSSFKMIWLPASHTALCYVLPVPKLNTTCHPFKLFGTEQ